ncbi:atrial natriuretic peptide-converting enzyme [Cylas formicarius]|uniref:atrial natriuretic peptide-converting enzyme n=1 Tax=Cylas formicarius TaxID=197179 RepID=UPI0029588A18|nr:atrial natriuretic peptide-converting enzyme [Cylas formicarius]XP_060529417.1 atrial natriuretic peptide-converting enzyme [Cylas formicarius]
MTISMDHKSHRKNSWDSKMSVSTVSSIRGTRNFRRSPSSILSSDSDIRFTRKKLSAQTRCGCIIIAIFLLFLLLAAVSVYVGYTYLMPEYPGEQIYKGTFRVIEGDSFLPELADPSSDKFKAVSRDYMERLNLLFRRSYVKHGYLGTDVLALDGTEGKDLIVHFDLRIDPSYVHIKADDLYGILANEVSVTESLFFQNITIDPNSLDMKPADALPQVYATTLPTIITTLAVTQTPADAPRTCTPLQLRYCSKLGYNVTTYPNVLEHKSIRDVREHVITFRELVDAECYRHAYEFVCQILQPPCEEHEEYSAEMILPCRSFCREFMSGCGSRLNEKFKNLIDCGRFPEFYGEGTCVTKPGCVEELQSRALSPRICDGVLDCQDLSDETSCSYCPKNHLHCGVGRACIQQSQRCDGKEDCPDGSDERACLNLHPSTKDLSNMSAVSLHRTSYHPEGYVTVNEKGVIEKLCTENLNRSLSRNRTEQVLRTLSSSLCKMLNYQDVQEHNVVKDHESDVSYVKMRDPLAQELNFVKSKCASKQVLKVTCDELECGIQNAENSKSNNVLPKMASHGDWPWHVALFKEDVHICDGVLLSPNWIGTTASCFQGQPKAEWIARFGAVRLMSTAPWEQERRIIGMVKSPVEGSTIALVRLDQPVSYNDFTRPVCLPEENVPLSSAIQCNTLGWARNREHLQRVQVQVVAMEKCENVSISNVNSFCTETIHGQNDCNEEEFAGSCMVCRLPNTRKWTLVGITNWRIACTKNGTERPRMYDKISSNVDWIRETISSSNNT